MSFSESVELSVKVTEPQPGAPGLIVGVNEAIGGVANTTCASTSKRPASSAGSARRLAKRRIRVMALPGRRVQTREVRTRSTLSALLRRRKRSGGSAFGALADGAQPGKTDQRAAGVDHTPVARKAAPRALVGGGHARLRGEQRALTAALELEVEGAL